MPPSASRSSLAHSATEHARPAALQTVQTLWPSSFTPVDLDLYSRPLSCIRTRAQTRIGSGLFLAYTLSHISRILTHVFPLMSPPRVPRSHSFDSVAIISSEFSYFVCSHVDSLPYKLVYLTLPRFTVLQFNLCPTWSDYLEQSAEVYLNAAAVYPQDDYYHTCTFPLRSLQPTVSPTCHRVSQIRIRDQPQPTRTNQRGTFAL